MDYDTLAFLQAVPQELRDRKQWVAWKLEKRDGEDTTKVPYSTRGYLARSNDPKTWTGFHDALKFVTRYRQDYSGVGFVLSKDDPYVGFDLDHCVDGQSIAPWAMDILQQVHSYTEVTPSGTGLRVFIKGSLPPFGRKKVLNVETKEAIEVYDSGRFLTMTGWEVRCSGCDLHEVGLVEERQQVLEAIHLQYFGTEKPTPKPAPAPARPSLLSDQEILDRASAASNGADFDALWRGIHSKGSASEDDLALCDHLVWWSGGSIATADRLFRMSGLMRDKWDTRHSADGLTYGEMTLGKARSGMTGFYEGRQNDTAPAPRPDFMERDSKMEELFNGN